MMRELLVHVVAHKKVLDHSVSIDFVEDTGVFLEFWCRELISLRSTCKVFLLGLLLKRSKSAGIEALITWGLIAVLEGAVHAWRLADLGDWLSSRVESLVVACVLHLHWVRHWLLPALHRLLRGCLLRVCRLQRHETGAVVALGIC